MRSRLCAVVAVATALFALGVGVAQAAAARAPARARQEVPAKKKKKHKATTTTVAKSASLPSDACKLLTLNEVTPFVATATEGKPVTNSGQANEVMCRWDAEETPGGPIDLTTLNVSVTEFPSSLPKAELKLGLAAEGKDPGNKQVSGLGDYAIVTSAIPPNAEVKVLVGQLLLDVEYSSSDPLGSTRQDDVVALAKLAFGRL
jgi:hypothetical protein